ncbi:MAG: hypothetical protein HY540_05610 [Deltaproteobacteria bacterium]|nr:hypothetical protein [Deltaproteobacteria bacterium]
MKKGLTLLIAVLTVMVANDAGAKKTTYVATNHRFNYVKRDEVSHKLAAERQMNHPADVDEAKLREALASIRIAKKSFGEEDAKTHEAFGESAINFLAVNLSKAFREAASNEEIVFSYLDKDPIFIIRNDRLTIGTVWIHGNELHVQFQKLWAKMTIDTDRRGNERKAASMARGMRIAFDPAPNQKLGLDDAKELIIDLSAQVNVAAEPAEKTTEIAVKGTPTHAPDAKERLQKLEALKKEGLITDKEYAEKRKEILQGL